MFRFKATSFSVCPEADKKISNNLAYMAHQTASIVREFSASRHFFKTNVTQSVAEFILYRKKKRNCGNFFIKFGELKCKNVSKQHFNTFMQKWDFA